MSDSQLPPPGWYPDPAGQGLRYWDGGRWTEHTQALAAAPPPSAPVAPVQPNPVPPAPMPPAPGQATPYGGPPAGPVTPVQPGAPAAFGAPGAYGAPGPAQPGAWGAAPAAPAAAGQSDALNKLVANLKRLEGFTVVMVGALLVAICTFLPWASGDVRPIPEAGIAGSSDSSNAWSGDGPWLIRGVSVDDALAKRTDGGTDMLILAPILVVGVGLVLLPKFGKKVANGAVIGAGLCAVFTVLLAVEAMHVNGWADDLNSKIRAANPGFTADYLDGGAAWGLWVAIAAAVFMTYGAARVAMAEMAAAKPAAAAPSPFGRPY